MKIKPLGPDEKQLIRDLLITVSLVILAVLATLVWL